MVRRAALLMILSLGIAGCDDNNTPTQPSDPNVVTFRAVLLASNEVPPVTNEEINARGDALILVHLNRDASNNIASATVNITVNLNSFPPGTRVTLAHIHEGTAGVAGGARVNTGLSPATAITLTDGSLTGRQFTNLPWNNPTQIQSAISNPAGWYFNVHTEKNPGGAVRGQLVKQ